MKPAIELIDEKIAEWEYCASDVYCSIRDVINDLREIRKAVEDAE